MSTIWNSVLKYILATYSTLGLVFFQHERDASVSSNSDGFWEACCFLFHRNVYIHCFQVCLGRISCFLCLEFTEILCFMGLVLIFVAFHLEFQALFVTLSFFFMDSNNKTTQALDRHWRPFQNVPLTLLFTSLLPVRLNLLIPLTAYDQTLCLFMEG